MASIPKPVPRIGQGGRQGATRVSPPAWSVLRARAHPIARPQFQLGTAARFPGHSSLPALAPANQRGQVVTRATLALEGSSADHSSNKYDAEIWGVALPALASMLLEPIMGVINAGMIGQLGTQQLGAVSVASMIVSFTTFLFSFLLFLTTPEVAAAVVKGDKAEVSRISSKSLWVSLFFGLITTGVLLFYGPDIIALMAPPEPAVAMYASQYVAIRSWGITMVLASFVATGTYRGFKDTKTPLYAAVGSAVCSLALNYLFIMVLQWGVVGGALAVTLAQAVSCVVLWSLLVKKGMMKLQDMARPPSIQSVLPMLRKGMVLGIRSVISFGMILYASALCVRAGSAYQAGFEVIRQVWMLTIQFFECLNVATQTLCAAYLGAGDRKSAKAVLERLLFLGTTVGAAVGVVVFAAQDPITEFFTKDPMVIAQVMSTIPLVCFMFPLDAGASIMDGSLLASKQTDYMSVVQILGSGFQFLVLAYITTNGLVSCLSIWTTLKVLTLCRFAGGAARNWFSPKSGYIPLSTPATPTKTIATTAATTTTATTAAAPANDLPAPHEAPAAPSVVKIHHVVAGHGLGEPPASSQVQEVVQGVQGQGIAQSGSISDAEEEAVAEAIALQQDMMNVDLVPGSVCCMDTAQEEGQERWHAKHDCKPVPGDGVGGAQGQAGENELQAASSR